jgi:endonuclease/exonuclease/phosphatase family metal-dependent hydrolase
MFRFESRWPCRFALLPGVLLAMALLRATDVGAAPAAAPATLRLATWNLEWLLSPQTARDLRVRCQRGERRLPCDVVQISARSDADYRALGRQAALLAADVVALQEVEGAEVAARLFAGYDFCFTQRRDWQNVGFAIRKGIAHRCAPDVLAISLADRVRRGAALTLFPGEARELHLLAVHLKSGCSRDDLQSSLASCRVLARQGPGLAAWVDAQVAAGRAFAVLGDFNRDLRAEQSAHAGLWAQLADGQPRDEQLRDAGAGTAFVPCQTGQPFTRYIDYIVLGGPLAARQVAGSFARQRYKDVDAHRFRLSDHCPLSVAVRLR